MTSTEGEELEKVLDRYARAEEEFQSAGGYSATAEAEAIATNLGLPEKIFSQLLNELSGGQRRRVELARILLATPKRCYSMNQQTTSMLIRSSGSESFSQNTLVAWSSLATMSTSSKQSLIASSISMPIATSSMCTTWVGENIFLLGNRMSTEGRRNVRLRKNALRFSRSKGEDACQSK